MLSFYGISVTQLAMMTPNDRRLRGLVKLINNPLSGRIRETKEHAIYLRRFIDNLPQGYDDPVVRSLEMKLKASSSTTISSFSNPLRSKSQSKSPEEIQEEIDSLVESKGLKKKLINSFIDIEGRRISLSENAFSFLQQYIDLYYSRLEKIVDNCVEGVLSEIRVFGRSPNALFNRPGIMEYAVTEMFSKKGDGKSLPFSEIYKRLSRDVEICKGIIESYDNRGKDVRASRSEFEEASKPSAFLAYLESRGIPEDEVNTLQEKYLENYDEFINGVSEFISKGFVKVPEMNNIIDFYFEIYLLDYSPTYLMQLVNLPVEREDFLDTLDYIHSELNGLGFYYFNRKNLQHFLESLRSIILGEEEGHLNVDSKPETGTKTFRQVFRDLYYGFASLRPSGSRMGEEELDETTVSV